MKNMVSVLAVICGVVAIIMFSVLTTKIMAEEKEELVEVKVEMKTESELIEMANRFNKDMGFVALPDPKVKEEGESSYVISSKVMKQKIIVWYDYEDKEWDIDYLEQPYVRTF